MNGQFSCFVKLTVFGQSFRTAFNSRIFVHRFWTVWSSDAVFRRGLDVSMVCLFTVITRL